MGHSVNGTVYIWDRQFGTMVSRWRWAVAGNGSCSQPCCSTPAGRGRQAAERGNPAELLTDALAIWRGPALADERAHLALGDQEAAASCRAEYRAVLTTLNLNESCLYLPNPAPPR